MRRDPDAHDEVARAIVGIGNDYPAAFELAPHSHRRGQLLHAEAGVIAVSTPEGAWVTPPARGIWIPAGIPHAVRMIGAVSTRSVMIAAEAAAALGPHCRVLQISPLLRALLVEAVDMPLEYDEASRDGMVAALLIAEAARAPTIPLAVPFPAHPRLAAQCQAFLARPDAGATTDSWAEALAMNRRSFTRLFRRETGLSFAQWKRQACLAVALPQLAAGTPVTTVALDLGYDSPASFSTMFKQALGRSPSRYQ